MSERAEQSRLVNDFFVRKADLDDVESLNKLITDENKSDLNLLFDHPKLISLFERFHSSNLDLLYH